MSEQSRGPGWWQASDQLWYPPDQRPGVAPGGRRWMAPAAALLAVAVLAGAVTFFVVGSGEEAQASTVALEPVETAGPDPFTESVAVVEVAEFPDEVRAVTAEVTTQLSSDVATGTLVATGDTPGLYGGTRDDAVCDVESLGTFLGDNSEKASAWAGVAGVDTAQIPEFLAGLTSVVLTSDTWVTNHGFSDGAATPRSSVLQAGTAVLVDDTGAPRVRCSCGNPLSAPPSEDLSTAATTGTAWGGYSPAAVTVVDPSAASSDLTLVDLASGDTYQAPVGIPPEPEVEPVTEEELLNLRLESFDNSEWGNGGSDVQLVDGTAPLLGGEFGENVSVDEVIIADVDGDGIDDGVADLASYYGGNFEVSTVLVLLASDRSQREINYLSDVESTWVPGVRRMAVEAGQIVIETSAYVQSDPNCCPSLLYRERFEFDGESFRRESIEQIPA